MVTRTRGANGAVAFVEVIPDADAVYEVAAGLAHGIISLTSTVRAGTRVLSPQ
jgi:hypothetical protein